MIIKLWAFLQFNEEIRPLACLDLYWNAAPGMQPSVIYDVIYDV